MYTEYGFVFLIYKWPGWGSAIWSQCCWCQCKSPVICWQHCGSGCLARWLASNDWHIACLLCNLVAFCNKSKVLVFRTGSRLSNSLEFKYGYDNIEILNSYKYLGVDITYNLSSKKHLQNELSAAKLAINSTWSKYINHPLISKDNKTKIFNVASRSIMFMLPKYVVFKNMMRLKNFYVSLSKKCYSYTNLHQTTWYI